MSILMETYNEINRHIKELSDKIYSAEERINAIDNRRNNEIPDRISNLEKQLEKIDEYKLKIEGFRLLAEKNIDSKNVLTIEAPPGYRVNLNRLRNWAMMIDPIAENDPYAQRVYVVAKCDEYFLEQKKQEFTERIEQLKSDFETGSTEELKTLEQEIADLKNELSFYASSDEMRDFAKLVVEENSKYIFEDCPGTYSPNESAEAVVSPGATGIPLAFDDNQKKYLKSLMGKYYDEKGGRAYFPFEEMSLDREFGMTISCIPSRKRLNEMDAGIRNLIFNIINKSLPGSRKVYVIDAERQNSSVLGSLRPLEGTFALADVPRNSEQITAKLEEIVSGFADIDEILEHHDSVIEYNAEVDDSKKIDRKVIVFIGWPKAFKGKDAEFVNRIITNYERYGVSFVSVSIKNEVEKEENFGISEYLSENIIHINMSNTDTTLSYGNKQLGKFAWYTFKHNLADSFVESLKEHTVQKNEVGNEYTKRYSLDNMPEYTRGNKSINLPFGVNGKDEAKSISFDNENFASFLMGASGSGKSTLIHTLITGIINNYHPDDVELWLADFKMSEFAQYINPRPPHIKYILLDESKELVYDLIDKLTDIMMKRQRFFMNNKELKKVENVPSSTYMPIIFVMFDEFSIMSQAVSESEAYKLKLQNLLAKGRALGIKFLFASQTFSKGVTGLTGTAKEQIQSRIAMKNSTEEIVETLQLSSSLKTEQVRNWMDALPAHYALYKYRNGDSLEIQRLHAMYFEGVGDEAYKKQRELISRINDNMKAVDISQYNPDERYVYVDKEPVVVDGNSYEAFNINKFTKGKERLVDSQKGLHTGDEMHLDLGVPRLMVNQKLVSVLPESRENILLLGKPSEYPCCGSIIMSIVEQAKAQNVKVAVWAYGRNKLYLEYKNLLTDVNIELVEGTEAICQAIRTEKEKILTKECENKIIILLGMDRICVDFQYLDGESSALGITASVNSIIQKAADNSDKPKMEQVLDAMRTELQRRFSPIKKEIRAAGEKAGKSKDQIKEEINEERMRLATEIEAEFSNELASASEEKNDDVTVEPVVDENVESADDLAYNAAEDFKMVVKQSSRNGIHFMLALNSIADIKPMGITQDEFRHKIAFQLSVDDSRTVFQNKDAASIPEHVCIYDDTIERFSFRPYLQKGITWDGWYVSEDGQVMSPLDN